jgi:hypothetical protein
MSGTRKTFGIKETVDGEYHFSTDGSGNVTLRVANRQDTSRVVGEQWEYITLTPAQVTELLQLMVKVSFEAAGEAMTVAMEKL